MYLMLSIKYVKCIKYILKLIFRKQLIIEINAFQSKMYIMRLDINFLKQCIPTN